MFTRYRSVCEVLVAALLYYLLLAIALLLVDHEKYPKKTKTNSKKASIRGRSKWYLRSALQDPYCMV